MRAPLTSSSHSRFEVLDGMRGVAALSVMILHFTEFNDHPYLGNAALAVDIFFMLSGFVIAHSYSKRLLNGLTAREYMGKRLIRLYPLFLVGQLIGLPILCWTWSLGFIKGTARQIAISFFGNIFYLPSLQNSIEQKIGPTFHLKGTLFPSNPTAWSLFFEIVASISFLFFFRLKRNSLVKIVAASLVIYFICGVIKELGFHSHGFDFNMGWSTAHFWGGFPRVTFGFCFGLLLHSVVADARLQFLRDLVRRFVKIPLIIYIALLLVFLIPKQAHGLYQLIGLSVAAPLLVFAGALVNCPNELSLNIARFLGWISYPLYCIHFPLGAAIMIYSSQAHLSPIIGISVSILVSIGLACVLTRFYDEPCRNYLSARFFQTHAPTPVTEAAKIA